MNIEGLVIFLLVTILVAIIVIVPSIYFVRSMSKKIRANKKLNDKISKLERKKVTKIGIIYNLVFTFFLMAGLSLYILLPNIRMPAYLIILLCVVLLGVIGERILLRLGLEFYEKNNK